MSLLSKLQLAVFCMATSAGTVALADTAESAANTGASVYEESCEKCHSGGIGGFFSGAPKTGDQEEWAALIEKGVPTLTENTVNGIGDMKPMGDCETCTDSNIAAAVEYMVEESR
jgi:cytochrome c5